MSVRKERIFLKIENKLYDFISYKERRKNALLNLEKKVYQYSSMSDTEFLMDYVNAYAKYERKKLILIFSIPVIIALLFNIGSGALTVISKLSVTESYTFIVNEKVNAIIDIVLILTTVLFIFGIFFIIIFINQFYALAKDKRTIEEIKSIRK